jgi:hypothetical protein
MYGPLEIFNIYTYEVGSLIEGFWKCGGGWGVWLYHTFIEGGDQENCSVGEYNSNICKDVVKETKLM